MADSPEARGSLLTLPELNDEARAALARAGLNSWAVRGHSDFVPIETPETPVSTPQDGFDVMDVAID